MAEFDEFVLAYVKARDKVAEIVDGHKKELQPYHDLMFRLEGYFLEQLNLTGSQSNATKFGTVFKKTRITVKVPDWEEFMTYVKETDNYGLLERRVSKKAITDLQEAGDEIPPGLEIERELIVEVRRPKAGA